MKVNKCIFFSLFMLFTVASFAQSLKESIYQDFIKGSMTDWKVHINFWAAKATPSNADKLELVRAYYGYVAYSLGVKKKSEAEVYIEKGDLLIESLIKQSYSLADVYALKAAFIGFKIGVSPYKAPFLGKSSSEAVDKALSLDPNNIQATTEKANILYYSPSVFGGDKKKALEKYYLALSLFEKDEKALFQNWLYLNLLTQIAKVQTEIKNYAEAKKVYQKILAVEPNYKYVKEELYPSLLKKMS